jgi:Protein of unknown function (DUF3038)
MSQSASILTNSSYPEPSNPSILGLLPDVNLATQVCSPRTCQQIDLLLLALEALELGGSEYILAASQELGLQKIIKNRVTLWRLRSTNPWRRSYRRNSLKLDEAKALVTTIGDRSKKLMIPIRQLLIAEQQMLEKGLPVENHFRLSEYLERFRSHFRGRMNARRAKVSVYLSNEEQLNELALSLLSKLLFCTGTKGVERLWIGLFDGEVV